MSEKSESVCYNMSKLKNKLEKLKHIIVAISIPNFRIFHKVVTKRQLEKCSFQMDAWTDGRIDRRI